jgi:hypothetical protein
VNSVMKRSTASEPKMANMPISNGTRRRTRRQRSRPAPRS